MYLERQWRRHVVFDINFQIHKKIEAFYWIIKYKNNHSDIVLLLNRNLPTN